MLRRSAKQAARRRHVEYVDLAPPSRFAREDRRAASPAGIGRVASAALLAAGAIPLMLYIAAALGSEMASRAIDAVLQACAIAAQHLGWVSGKSAP